VRPLERERSLRDVLAGLQLAAMSIPQALGYARIAGMPVVTGLYTLLLPPIAFAVFASSRYLVVAADSATAAILYGGISGLATPGSPRYVQLAGLTALLTAVLLLLARILKLGFLADFLSRTVLVGFLTGLGFQVGISVLGGMLGLEITAHRTLKQAAEIIRNLSHVNWLAIAVSVAVVGGIFLLQRWRARLPAPLIAVLVGIVASKVWRLADRGIAVIGHIDRGLPHVSLHISSWRETQDLIGIAFSCFVVILAQSAATARVYATRHRQELDEDADLLGLAAANASAAVSGTFVVNGSPTQTAMVEASGGTSQLAQIVKAVAVGLVVIWLTGTLEYLPRCVLGGVVFVIAVRLVDLEKLARMRRESPKEWAVALITALTVVVAGVLQGILVAMVLSLMRIVSHSYHPHTGVLVPGSDPPWQIVPAHYGAVSAPGIIIYRFGAPLFYANAGRFAREINTLLGPHPPAAEWVLVDAEAIDSVDYSAARVLRELQEEMAPLGVTLAFARVSPFLQADFDRHHVTEAVGSNRIFSRLHDALDTYSRSAAAT
jgi:high affinity sulfate transporter 1